MSHYYYPLVSHPFRYWLMLLLLSMLLLTSHGALSQQIVYYPRAESDTDARLHYPVALLKLCLENTSYKLKPTDIAMQQARNLRMLKQDKGLDVVWTVTTQEREAELHPIRIPIDRGLIGWRLLLIHQKNAQRFATITQAEQLMQLRAGQGHDWPDHKILANNQFSVTSSSSYEGLFQMLARGYIDYFPRSVSEIDIEAHTHKNMGLVIEPHLAIHYHQPLYYFVNKNNVELANAITAGLEKAIANGSMRTLFDQHYSEAITQAKLRSRTIITLENPLLPSETPPANSRYWFTPEDYPQ